MKITNLFNINKNDNKTYIAEENYDDKILKTAECINKADAIVI